MLKDKAVLNKKQRKSGKVPRLRMVVEGVGPVSPFNLEVAKHGCTRHEPFRIERIQPSPGGWFTRQALETMVKGF